MSRLPGFRRHHPAHATPTWPGLAVVIEAMILLVFLMASLAVITQVFSMASTKSVQGQRLAEAVACATNEAERFAADPAHYTAPRRQGELDVTCNVRSEDMGAGTLYHATITLSLPGAAQTVYELDTSCYERGRS